MTSIWQRFLLQLCQWNRLHQDYPGRWRICRFLEVQAGSHLAGLQARRAKVARGTYLHLDPRERYDGLKTLVHGLNPREPLVNVAMQLLRPGDNVLDIGANVGYFSALAALTVGERGQVFAFEASPSTYARLQTLVASNAHGNIRAFEAAVSDSAGEVEFHCGPLDHTGTASLRNLSDRTSSVTRVRALALDDLLHTLPTIRLVKIDVEGAESLVAKGMGALIRRDRPHVLVEVTDSFLRGLASNKSELVEIYRTHGYTPWRVQRELVPYVEQDEFQCDVLMVPAGSRAVGFDERLALGLRW